MLMLKTILYGIKRISPSNLKNGYLIFLNQGKFMSKTIVSVTDQLYSYMTDNWVRESNLLRELREETAKLEMAAMQISPDQGQFMAFMVKLIDARNILEVGTFTGYSALAMAQATHKECRILCCDVSQEWTTIAKSYWKRSDVEQKIELRLAPALETLQQLVKENTIQFDFSFIDADKANYDAYYEACLSLTRPGGIVAIDNVFWGGWVADESQQDVDTKAIRALNKKLQADERIDLSIVPIGDGLTLASKR